MAETTTSVSTDEHGTTRYVNAGGRTHRVDGPALIHRDGGEQWYLDGDLHRIDGPAVTYGDTGGIEWWVAGKHCESSYNWEVAVAEWRVQQAAPDLLESLRDLRAIIHDDLTHARQEDHADAIKRADAAIAKADGTTAQNGGVA